jgi:hypothetical protein
LNLVLLLALVLVSSLTIIRWLLCFRSSCVFSLIAITSNLCWSNFHDLCNLYYFSFNLITSIFDVWCFTLMFEDCWFSPYDLQIFMVSKVTLLDKFDMLRKWGWIKVTMYCLYACYEPHEFVIVVLVGMQPRQNWRGFGSFASFNVLNWRSMGFLHNLSLNVLLCNY